MDDQAPFPTTTVLMMRQYKEDNIMASHLTCRVSVRHNRSDTSSGSVISHTPLCIFVHSAIISVVSGDT